MTKAKIIAICSFSRFAMMAALTTCLEGMCFAQGRLNTESDSSICSGQGQSVSGWCRHYSLLLQSRLVTVFGVLPNQTILPLGEELSSRTIYNYNYIKNQEMLWPSSCNRWLYPCANNLSYLNLFHYKLNIALNCCALLGNKNSPGVLSVSPLNRIHTYPLAVVLR